MRVPQSWMLGFWSTMSFAAAWLATGLVRHLARNRGWLAKPRSDRWHQHPVALHGGAGFYPPFFFIGIVLLTCTAGLACQGNPDILPAQRTLGAALLMGSLLMFALGLWDDAHHLRPLTKLIGQFLSASLFIAAGGTFPVTDSAWVNHAVTYLWLIGITNAVNMLDNMDGLASGVVIISSMAIAVLAWRAVPGMHLGVTLPVLLAAGLAGFLLYNRFPASIFMGDSGSLSIGYLIAGLAVPSELNGFFGLTPTDDLLGHADVLLIPVLVLSIPICDTTFVTVTRMLRAQPVSQGGCDHLSHRLVRLGLPESVAVHLLYVLAIVGGVLAISLQGFPRQTAPWLLLFLTLLIGSGVYLGRVNVLDACLPRLRE